MQCLPDLDLNLDRKADMGDARQTRTRQETGLCVCWCLIVYSASKRLHAFEIREGNHPSYSDTNTQAEVWVKIYLSFNADTRTWSMISFDQYKGKINPRTYKKKTKK